MTRWLDGLAVCLPLRTAIAVGADAAPPNVLFIALDDLEYRAGPRGRAGDRALP